MNHRDGISSENMQMRILRGEKNCFTRSKVTFSLSPHLPDVDSEVVLLYCGGIAIGVSRDDGHGVVGPSCHHQPLGMIWETGLGRIYWTCGEGDIFILHLLHTQSVATYTSKFSKRSSNICLKFC